MKELPMIPAAIAIESVPVAIAIPPSAGLLSTLIDAALETVQAGLSARRKVAVTFQATKADGSSRAAFNWGKTAAALHGYVAADTEAAIVASRLDRIYVDAASEITGVVAIVHLGA